MKMIIVVGQEAAWRQEGIADTLVHFGYMVRNARNRAQLEGLIIGNPGDIAGIMLDGGSIPVDEALLESIAGKAPLIALSDFSPVVDMPHSLRLGSLTVSSSIETAEVARYLEGWHAQDEQALAA